MKIFLLGTRSGQTLYCAKRGPKPIQAFRFGTYPSKVQWIIPLHGSHRTAFSGVRSSQKSSIHQSLFAERRLDRLQALPSPLEDVLTQDIASSRGIGGSSQKAGSHYIFLRTSFREPHVGAPSGSALADRRCADAGWLRWRLDQTRRSSGLHMSLVEALRGGVGNHNGTLLNSAPLAC